MFFLNIFGLNMFTIVLISLIAIYFYLSRNFNYWKNREINGPKPIIIFGTMYEMFFTPIPEMFESYTKRYGKLTGGFFGSRPNLIISDPQLIKDINIRDFHMFTDRNDFTVGDAINERSLLNLKGEEWRKMRSIISPTFSSGKMRGMHPIVIDCVHRLEQVLDKKAINREEINLKKMISNLTMDVIASSAFGTRIDTHNEEKTSEFVTMAQKSFRISWRSMVFFVVSPVFPQLLKWFDFKFNDPSVENFFRSAIKSIVSRRKSEKGKHNDYLQLIINAQNKTLDNDDHSSAHDISGELFGQTKEDHSVGHHQFDVTDDDILANTFLFFVAGYETTASLISHLLYSLALNEKCQQKLYEEIKQFDDKFDYESIAQMPYLDACIAETLRMYPTITLTLRMANQDYKLGDTGLTIPKGMLVSANVQALHYNPEYYPAPERWDPERFMPENRDKLIPNTYMPFGAGPRNCVGMRFALMEAKTAISHLITKYRFYRTENTRVPLKPMKFARLLNTGEIKVGIECRQ